MTKLIIIGFLGGIPAGLLGLGGGVLFIPLMVYLAKFKMKIHSRVFPFM